MKTKHFLTFGFFLAAAVLMADVVPDFLFQDNMVFSANQPQAVTGTAAPGEKITVTLPGGTYSGVAGADGRFRVELPAMPITKKPFDLVISGKNKVVIRNVVAGLVWIAAGQSNMEVPVKEALNPEQEAASADYPLIREFKVQHDFELAPASSLKGKWTVVSPQTAPSVGAISFFFARIIQKELNGIPIGIINNSYSATPIQAWLPLEFLQSDPKAFKRHLQPYVEKFFPMGKQGIIDYRTKLGRQLYVEDTGNQGEKDNWHTAGFDDAVWKEITLPDWLESQYGEMDGSFWFRKTFELPAEYAGKDLEFSPGIIDDYDVTYFNGAVIGTTGEETPDTWDVPRCYRIPGKLVKAGKNTIAVRVFDSAHAGGFPPGGKLILMSDDKEILSLNGAWKTAAENIYKPKTWHPDYLPLVKIYRAPGVLYNAMFAPLRGTPVDGILWYQGESNAGDRQYKRMFAEMIRTWRRDLNNENLPFMFVQLAAYTKEEADPSRCGGWPQTRADQAAVLTELPETYMATAIDIGDARRIHPLNKQEVARRLALTALDKIYHQEKFKDAVVYPEFLSLEVRDGKFIISLKGAEGLTTNDGKPPRMFAIAGAWDRKLRKQQFYFADAVIRDGKIELTCPAVKKPVILRYGWMMNPAVNTVNAKGFPLLPFSVDLKK